MLDGSNRRQVLGLGGRISYCNLHTCLLPDIPSPPLFPSAGNYFLLNPNPLPFRHKPLSNGPMRRKGRGRGEVRRGRRIGPLVLEYYPIFWEFPSWRKGLRETKRYINHVEQ